MSVLCASNPDKVSGWEEDNHLPPRDFAYNFAKRNVLFIRSTMELSKARSILTVKDLEIWHKYTEDGLVVFNPKFRECFLDGSGKRILNMDESSLSLGESKTKILLFKSLNTEYRAHGSVARVSSVIFVSFDSGGQLFPFFLTYLDFVWSPFHFSQFPFTYLRYSIKQSLIIGCYSNIWPITAQFLAVSRLCLAGFTLHGGFCTTCFTMRTKCWRILYIYSIWWALDIYSLSVFQICLKKENWRNSSFDFIWSCQFLEGNLSTKVSWILVHSSWNKAVTLLILK